MAQDSKIDVSLGQGANRDDFSEQVAVSDMLNVLPSPNGKSLFNRNGLAKYGNLAPVLTGTDAGRIAYARITAPPNLTGGNVLILGVNTGKDNEICGGILTRPRGNTAGDTSASNVFFASATYSCDAGDSVVVTVNRNGALDRVVTVDYASADDTAVAGVNYTAISGTLTFAIGETAKTITFQTLGGAAGANTDALLKLTNPRGGAIVGDPRVTIITILAEFALTSSYTDDNYHRIKQYNWGANVVTGHYLNLTTGSISDTLYTGRGHNVKRVNDNLLVAAHARVAAGSSASTTGTMYVQFYQIQQILSDGGAYEDGAGSIGAAIKTDAWKSISFSCKRLDGQMFCIVPWTQDKCVLFGGYSSWILDLTTGTLESGPHTNPLPSGFSRYSVTGPGGQETRPTPFVDAEGMLVFHVAALVTTGGSNEYDERIFRVNMDDWTLDAERDDGGVVGPLTPLSDGTFLYRSAGTLYKVAQNLSTRTSLGAFATADDLAGYNDVVHTVNGTGLLTFNGNAANTLLRYVSTAASSHNIEHEYTGVSADSTSRNPGMGTLPGGITFLARYHTGAGTAATTVGKLSLSAVVSAALEQDQYNAQNVDSSFSVGNGDWSSITGTDNMDYVLYIPKYITQTMEVL